MTAQPVGAPRAHVTMLSVGGTIFMRQDLTGLRAAPDSSAGAALAQTMIDGVAVHHVEVANVGSPSVTPSHLGRVLTLAREAVDHGAAGVVLTHGTDTLEESAFLLDLVWDREAPLVITGAMRPSNAPGADGPANLRDAVRTAVSPSARGLGVLAVFDGQVHVADKVVKVSSRSVDAFASIPSGPIGIVGEEDMHLLYRPVDPRRGMLLEELPDRLPRVPILTAGIGEDGAVLDALMPEPRPTDGTAADGGMAARVVTADAGIASRVATADAGMAARGSAHAAAGSGIAGAVDGLVIAGVGMGHVAAAMVPRLRRFVDAGAPVVVATRIPYGGTSTHHYDYPGSEVDLITNGAVMAGRLSAPAARLLLQVLIASGAGRERIREEFHRYRS